MDDASLGPGRVARCSGRQGSGRYPAERLDFFPEVARYRGAGMAPAAQCLMDAGGAGDDSTDPALWREFEDGGERFAGAVYLVAVCPCEREFSVGACLVAKRSVLGTAMLEQI